MKALKKRWFIASIFFIIALSSFLRFYNYENRWGLAYDQAYGATVAKYAIREAKIPLLGPFSSAGPFQTGGEWYWFVMLGTIFDINNVNSPWIFLSLTSVVFVVAIIFLAKELIDEFFGILVGLLAAVSTSQIAQSFSLTNQSIIGIFSLLAVWASIRYIKSKKSGYLFLLGLCTSLAATIHLQGAALIFLVIATLLLSGLPKIPGTGLLFFGLFIPVIPLLIFDLNNNFVNSKNMIQYFLHDQYKISLNVLGRNWKTFILNFWPSSLAHIIGGQLIISSLEILATIVFIFYNVVQRKIERKWLVIVVSFIIMVFYLRYLRTPLFDSYIIFLHPFILLLAGFMLYHLFKRNRFLGLLFITIVVLGSIQKDIPELTVNGNNSAKEAQKRIQILDTKFPGEKFSIYSYKYERSEENLILGLYLYSKNSIKNNGRRISIAVATREARLSLGEDLLDLNSSSASELSKSGWGRINPEDIYKSTEEWYLKK